MAINLDGIIRHDAEISVVGREGVFITTTNQKLLSEAAELPFNTHRLSNIKIVVWTGGTDAIAVAERIAISWENDGFNISRFVRDGINYAQVQSFVLA